MSLTAAAYHAGWIHALDTATAHCQCDCGRQAISAARFDGIATAETRTTTQTPIEVAGAVVEMLLDTAATRTSGVVEQVAARLVVDDLDAAAETITLLAVLAVGWRDDLTAARDDLRAATAPPLTPRWALGPQVGL